MTKKKKENSDSASSRTITNAERFTKALLQIYPDEWLIGRRFNDEFQYKDGRDPEKKRYYTIVAVDRVKNSFWVVDNLSVKSREDLASKLWHYKIFYPKSTIQGCRVDFVLDPTTLRSVQVDHNVFKNSTQQMSPEHMKILDKAIAIGSYNQISWFPLKDEVPPEVAQYFDEVHHLEANDYHKLIIPTPEEVGYKENGDSEMLQYDYWSVQGEER